MEKEFEKKYSTIFKIGVLGSGAHTVELLVSEA